MRKGEGVYGSGQGAEIVYRLFLNNASISKLRQTDSSRLPAEQF